MSPVDVPGPDDGRPTYAERHHNTLTVSDAFLAEGFAQIPNIILRAGHMSLGSRTLFAILLSYAWQKDHCFPGYDTLTTDMGLGEDAIRRYMKELNAAGLLTGKQRGLGLTAMYRLHFPAGWPDVPGGEPPPTEDQEPAETRVQAPAPASARVLAPAPPREPLKNTQSKNTQSVSSAGAGAGAGARKPAPAPDNIRTLHRRTPEQIATWEPVSFGQAWVFFGRVGNVADAAKAWDKLRPDYEMMCVMKQAMVNQRAAYGWDEPDGQYQPHFATWVNRGDWANTEPVATKVRRSNRRTR